MKKAICLILTVCMLAVFSPLASFAAVVNMVYVSEQITSEPTVYLGEIVYDGAVVLRYIYSEGSLSLLYYFGSAEMDEVTAEFIGQMENTAFYELISDRWDQARTETYDYYVDHVTDVEPNIRLSSDESLTAGMDETWSSAAAVAAQLYPAATVVSESSENVYDIDEGFAAALDAYDLERTEYVDEPIASDKRVIMTTDSNAENDNVYYTVEDGQVVKHVDTYIVYDCAAITVVYTCVELTTTLGTSDFEYREKPDGTLEITNYTGRANEVTVPSAIGGKTVTSIAANVDNYDYDVFAWMDDEYNEHSPSVIHLPDTLTCIGEFAFSGCVELTGITIPESVTTIGDYAFSCCESLASVVLPDGVTAFGCEVFDCCSALESVVFPDSLTEIPRGTFFWCTSLTNVTLPSGLTAIEDQMFSGCTSLQSIVIPETVTSIGQEAFYDCGLLSITIPAGTTLTASSVETNIYGDPYTIYYYPVGYTYDEGIGDTVPVDGFTVRCYRGSSAEAYAQECGFNIEYLDNALLGDTDGNGVLSISDVSVLLNILSSSTAQNALCDVDRDGDVSITDVTALLNILAA